MDKYQHLGYTIYDYCIYNSIPCPIIWVEDIQGFVYLKDLEAFGKSADAIFFEELQDILERLKHSVHG